jgi:CSLREA domain-containing protein
MFGKRLALSLIVCAWAPVALLVAPGAASAASTIAVTSTADTVSSGTGCTLRDALDVANHTSNPALPNPTTDCPVSGSGSPYTISLQAAQTYNLGTIDNYWFGPDALPPISDDVSINGNGATITRTGLTAMRFFYVSGGLSGIPGGSLTLRDLTLSNGLAHGGNGGSGGAGGGAGLGGAIFNQGTVTIRRSTLSGNVAQGGSGSHSGAVGGGGGIGSDGTNNAGSPADVGGGFGGPAPGASGGSGFAPTAGNTPGGGGGGFRPTDNATGTNGGGLGGFGGNGSAEVDSGDGGAGGNPNTGSGIVGGAGGNFGAGGNLSGGGGDSGGGGGGVGGGGGPGLTAGGGGFGGGGGASFEVGADGGSAAGVAGPPTARGTARPVVRPVGLVGSGRATATPRPTALRAVAEAEWAAPSSASRDR